MRIPIRWSAVMIVAAGTLAILLGGTIPANAQCSMMGGGGHDHAKAKGDATAKPASSDKQLRQSIDRVLAEERGRVLLANALMQDDAFIDSLLIRLRATPEWRARMAQRMADPASPGAKGQHAGGAPNGASFVYACPMHPEVTSPSPGDCPRCGMALVRGDARRE